MRAQVQLNLYWGLVRSTEDFSLFGSDHQLPAYFGSVNQIGTIVKRIGPVKLAASYAVTDEPA